MGIGSCEGVPGVPLMLRCPKLQKRSSDQKGTKWGVHKIVPHLPIFFDLGSLAHGPKWGGAKSKPPMWAPKGSVAHGLVLGS